MQNSQLAFWAVFAIAATPALLLFGMHNMLLKHMFCIKGGGNYPVLTVNAYDVTVMLWASTFVLAYVRHANPLLFAALAIAMFFHVGWARRRFGVSPKGTVPRSVRMYIYDISLILWVFAICLSGNLNAGVIVSYLAQK